VSLDGKKLEKLRKYFTLASVALRFGLLRGADAKHVWDLEQDFQAEERGKYYVVVITQRQTVLKVDWGSTERLCCYQSDEWLSNNTRCRPRTNKRWLSITTQTLTNEIDERAIPLNPWIAIVMVQVSRNIQHDS
jgi:hypothetical protein